MCQRGNNVDDFSSRKNIHPKFPISFSISRRAFVNFASFQASQNLCTSDASLFHAFFGVNSEEHFVRLRCDTLNYRAC
ncbi:hypothetical protein MNBD_GAMMA20-1228 [hydrothermal vent metagenome]|uniref:Uncharacterized protein n=1 Tax=hydrothermal vent metagenome TaxID=652676 RepID=A0A3B1B622_9ZZZZ